MYKFTTLTAEPRQEITMILDDNSRVVFNFEYKANQLGWFFGIKYGEINFQNIRLVTSYNLLRSYRNYLPFGLRVDTSDFEEPMNLEDFISGYAKVYLLTQDDIKAIEGNYYAKVSA